VKLKQPAAATVGKWSLSLIYINPKFQTYVAQARFIWNSRSMSKAAILIWNDFGYIVND
jgi:hypothetical protein